jgi:hypothetical protein
MQSAAQLNVVMLSVVEPYGVPLRNTFYANSDEYSKIFLKMMKCHLVKSPFTKHLG